MTTGTVEGAFAELVAGLDELMPWSSGSRATGKLCGGSISKAAYGPPPAQRVDPMPGNSPSR